MPGALIAAVEAGGTKILCAVVRPDRTIVEQARIPTGDPAATFASIGGFFAAAAARHGPVAAAGIASFGPLDLDRRSPGYGRLMETPKSGWSHIDVLGRIGAIVGAPAAIDTDVNCAALAEARHGAGRGLDRICYVTVGTGIGVGFFGGGDKDGVGTAHPEVGHIRVPRAAGDDFMGICPAHGDCLEGLASGPAMEARWGIAAENLPDGHVGWRHAAHYVATLCVNLAYVVRPQRIVVGGGVLGRPALLEAVRGTFHELMAGYALDPFCADPDTFIAAPALDDPSPGLIGAFEIAPRA